jgi:hypothetical protein
MEVRVNKKRFTEQQIAYALGMLTPREFAELGQRNAGH